MTSPLTTLLILLSLTVSLSPQCIDLQCIGGADRVIETLLPRLRVLGIVGPFFHITGFVARAYSTAFLVGFTLVPYAIMMPILVTEDMAGTDVDTLYWLTPGHCNPPLVCMRSATDYACLQP